MRRINYAGEREGEETFAYELEPGEILKVQNERLDDEYFHRNPEGPTTFAVTKPCTVICDYPEQEDDKTLSVWNIRQLADGHNLKTGFHKCDDALRKKLSEMNAPKIRVRANFEPFAPEGHELFAAYKMSGTHYYCVPQKDARLFIRGMEERQLEKQKESLKNYYGAGDIKYTEHKNFERFSLSEVRDILKDGFKRDMEKFASYLNFNSLPQESVPYFEKIMDNLLVSIEKHNANNKSYDGFSSKDFKGTIEKMLPCEIHVFNNVYGEPFSQKYSDIVNNPEFPQKKGEWPREEDRLQKQIINRLYVIHDAFCDAMFEKTKIPEYVVNEINDNNKKFGMPPISAISRDDFDNFVAQARNLSPEFKTYLVNEVPFGKSLVDKVTTEEERTNHSR